jgi:molybdate transport system substrate-binding protein
MRRALAFCISLCVLMLAVPNPTHAAVDRLNPADSSLPKTVITVSAAASLTDVFPLIAKAFTTRYPQLSVRFNFGGSNALVEQLRSGIPVDVLATASEPTMWAAVRGGWASPKSLPFAKNSMVIATPAGNPAGIKSLDSLQLPNVLTAVCVIEVPCGLATRRLFSVNNVSVAPVTKELDVRAVLGKVITDQVDAGIVFTTDARSAGKSVTTITIPSDKNVRTTYLITTVIDSSKQQAAQAFVDYVRYSTSAQSILRVWGFEKAW